LGREDGLLVIFVYAAWPPCTRQHWMVRQSPLSNH
jgi:hypothetical protein